MFVPVVDTNQKPLMPTTPSRARRWVKSGKATPFWKKGIFCVRLNDEPRGRVVQPIAVGIDPGSKREGFTVKSRSHTFLNIQTSTVDWVSKAIELRRGLRQSRRFRHTPYRQHRLNRSRNGLPASVRARWDWKLRIVCWLIRMFPVTDIVVEDTKAKYTGCRKWDTTFAPLQCGKTWFYNHLRQIANLTLKNGFDTKLMRASLGLKKSRRKLLDSFAAHCVDSWILANSAVGGHTTPDNTTILVLVPIRLHRRQLHVTNPTKGGIRKRYGGTRSLGFKKGSLIKHPKYGLAYVGGHKNGRITLQSLTTGQRLCRNAKPCECRFLAYNSWRFYEPDSTIT